MVPKPPFKGRQASDLVAFANDCLDATRSETDQIECFGALTLFLLDMDSDCLPNIKIENEEEDANGLQPNAMVQKMDMLLLTVIRRFSGDLPDSLYAGILDIFESSVLKLYQPHYIQFVTYYAASSTKERANTFLSLLLNIIHDDDADPIARREAISFLGSFVVRSKVLSWTHSSRVARYLVSFGHSLKDASSTQDKTLLVLTIQTLLYITCWECDRWQVNLSDPELEWISRSRKSLVSLLDRHKLSGAIRLVDLEILRTVLPLCGRLSVQLKNLVSETISTYKYLLTPAWKIVSELNLLKPHFPFDPFTNLPKTCPHILPLCREFEQPSLNIPDHDDTNTVSSCGPVDDSSAQEDNQAMEEDVGALWDFGPLHRAITGGEDSMVMASPLMGPMSAPPPLEDGNLVLSRILSSQKFASAPSRS